MGLDNIPKHYPCKTNGTAVLEVRRNPETGEALRNEDGTEMTFIDCQATQACGGCTWRNDYEASGIDGGVVYGILGTDCWYRGKYGNYLLEAFDVDTEDFTFYGDNEDGTVKSAASCRSVADALDNAVGGYAGRRGEFVVDGADRARDARYAAWWLRWAAETTDGCDCWY